MNERTAMFPQWFDVDIMDDAIGIVDGGKAERAVLDTAKFLA